ncbi:AI-2E family transporter [Rhodococcus hoagii]|nr:AI-2E family transporter [Prescottella equi]
MAKWSLCLAAIAIGALVVGWILQKLWVIALPVMLAIVVSTVLWPPTRALTKRGVRGRCGIHHPAHLLRPLRRRRGSHRAVGRRPSPRTGDKATQGIQQVQDWLKGPPVNLQDDQIDTAVHAITSKLQESGTAIASGVFTGVTTAGSMVVTLFLVLILAFFFVKDGPLHPVAPRSQRRPRRTAPRRGPRADVGHLGGFIRTQALVSLIDAVFIGAGR